MVLAELSPGNRPSGRRGGDRQGSRLKPAGDQLKADLLLISTSVACVAIDFGRPEQRWLERLTRAQAEAYLAEGQFAEGSMAPKIRAIIRYLDRPGRRGLITDPASIGRALRGEAGTEVVLD